MPRLRTWGLAGMFLIALPGSAFANHAGPLSGQWHLDEPCCSLLDTSGHGLTGAPAGSPTYGVAGRFGSALRFPTENDYVNAGSQAQLQPPTVTLLAWVRSDSVPIQVKAVVSQGASGSCSFSSYALYTGGSQDTAGLRFYVWNGSQLPVSGPASNSMWDGAWHLAAGTYDGATVRLYVDGQEVGSGTPGTGPIGYGLGLNNDFIIGGALDPACTEQTNFTGDVDEVRVYSRALSATEIGRLAAATGPDPPLLVPDGAGPGPGSGPGGKTTLADLPLPAVGRTFNVEPVSGKVRVGVPRGAAAARRGAAAQKGITFVPLEEARQIPVGSYFDVTGGTVRVRGARGTGRKTQQGDFAGALFQMLQRRTGKERGLTEARLKGSSFSRCRTARGHGTKASAAAAKRLSRATVRRLRANARGRFRTRGRYSAATVRGTIWTTTDRCDGTLTSVKRGRVVVRDFRRTKTILLTAGKSYLARAPG